MCQQTHTCEKDGRNQLLLLYKASLSIIQVFCHAIPPMTLKGSGLGGLGNSVTVGVADCQHPSNEGVYWQTAHRDAGFDYSDLHWFPLIL